MFRSFRLHLSAIFLLFAMLYVISGAYANQGVVYDLVDYRGEIGAPRPWAEFASYKETLGNATMNPVNDYVSAVSAFVKARCPIEYCKHTLIVGGDFVTPLWRDLRGDKVIFSDDWFSSTTDLLSLKRFNERLAKSKEKLQPKEFEVSGPADSATMKFSGLFDKNGFLIDKIKKMRLQGVDSDER